MVCTASVFSMHEYKPPAVPCLLCITFLQDKDIEDISLSRRNANRKEQHSAQLFS